MGYTFVIHYGSSRGLALIAWEGNEMRILLVGLLMTGLFVIGLSTYDRRAASAGEETVPTMVTNEDGTPIPQPSPKRPK